MPNFSLEDDVFVAAARQFGTPIHLYDERGIRETARKLNSAFSWAKDFKEYFAVKALPNPRILEILKQEGCGVDCSSECELILAERGGFAGEDIMFSANAMPPEEFAHTRRLGGIINLDDLSDIDTLKDNGGVPETICVRYNPGNHNSAGNGIMGQPEESKYGWTRAQLSQGLPRLKALGAKKFGLHAFLVSNATDLSYYPRLAGMLLELGKALAEETGMTFAFINLSGGIGIPYRPEERTVDIMAVGEGVRREYMRVLGDPADANVAVKTELGRYMTGPHGWLITKAVHEKDIYRRYLGVDATASDLMRPAMYGAYHHIHVAGRREDIADAVYDVTGSLCENNDKFAVARSLPKVRLGELLVIHDTGAHGLAMGYQYNGRLRCAEALYCADGTYQLIRRAETPEDYFATLV